LDTGWRPDEITMAQRDDYDDHDDAGWFRDQLRQRDREIAELKIEKDEQADLIRRFSEHAEDYNSSLERWQEVFRMVLTDGGWTWEPFWKDHWELVDEYSALVRQWNRMLPHLSAQDVGRPLAASEAQARTVTKLHERGMSLRAIVDETNLSLRTVRTIVGRAERTDRTTKKRLQRIEIDKFRRMAWKSQKRTGDALPKQVQTVIETGAALVKEAKGLGRGR
jgi:hypothetical protein